jgi:hypothetical protein
MKTQEIKEKITELAQKYHLADEDEIGFEIIYLYEQEAEDLIIAYCISQNYLINGFPTEKKVMEDDDDDYFCRERYQLYLDTLTLQKEDVANLMWTYNSHFWPKYFESKEEYIASIEHQLKSVGFYDVELD